MMFVFFHLHPLRFINYSITLNASFIQEKVWVLFFFAYKTMQKRRCNSEKYNSKAKERKGDITI